MHDRETTRDTMNRRTFLRGCGAGLGYLLLAGLPGCAPPGKDPDGPEIEQPGDRVFDQKKGFVHPVASPWFSDVGQGNIRCTLCPRQCTLADGERSFCRVRENRGGTGYTLAHGNPALLQEDPIERKPFFHVLPGSRALSISTAGCNLECKFCEVWDMALEHPENVYAHDVPPERAIELAEQSGVDSVSYAFGEPVVFYEYMAEVASLARKATLLNLVHTAGYIRPEPLKALLGIIDAANVDLKGFDEAFYRDVTGGELGPVLDALVLLKDAGVHIEITNLLIPTLNDDMEQIQRMCEWIEAELGPGVPLHFARFYPLYKLSELPRTPVSTLERARDIAREAGLHFVYIARVTGHEGENTFCPGCGEKIIDRMGFVIAEVHMEKGRCAHCGTGIPGRWA